MFPSDRSKLGGIRAHALVPLGLLLSVLGAPAIFAQAVPTKAPYLDSSLPVQQRVNDLVSHMTLAEKVSQMKLYLEYPQSSSAPLRALAGFTRDRRFREPDHYRPGDAFTLRERRPKTSFSDRTESRCPGQKNGYIIYNFRS